MAPEECLLVYVLAYAFVSDSAVNLVSSPHILQAAFYVLTAITI